MKTKKSQSYRKLAQKIYNELKGYGLNPLTIEEIAIELTSVARCEYAIELMSKK